jgi:hypothetical protein
MFKKADYASRLLYSLRFYILGLIFIIIFVGSFYFLHFDTFICSILAFSFGIITIWLFRRDLIFNSLLSGVLIIIISFLIYSTVQLITPGWVHAFWYFINVPHIIIFNVPIDDLTWYFLAGAFIGPLYEFWKWAEPIDEKILNKS